MMKIVKNDRTGKYDVYAFGPATGMPMVEDSFDSRKEANAYVKAKAMTENGVTTVRGRGEKFEECVICGRPAVQYDYRHTDGELFSCVKPTLEKCREARDLWLEAKKGGKRS